MAVSIVENNVDVDVPLKKEFKSEGWYCEGGGSKEQYCAIHSRVRPRGIISRKFSGMCIVFEKPIFLKEGYNITVVEYCKRKGSMHLD